MRRFLALCVLGSAAAMNTASAADITSGLEIGDFPKAFNVTDITGPAAGNGQLCYRCRYGAQPVVTIFTRKMDENVAKLVKEIDTVVGKNREGRMAAFVVLLTDDPNAEESHLKNVAEAQGIQHTPLTVFDNSAGPSSYRLSKDADVTVLMWVDDEVKVNHALKLADVNTKTIGQIAGDTSRILN